MRFILLLIGVPVMLIVLAALLLPLLLDKDRLLELASTTVYEQTGATLAVGGDIDLDLFPGIGVALGDTSLTMPGEQQASLRARSLLIGVRLLPLLTGKVAIEKLVVDGMELTVQQQAPTGTVDTSQLSDQQLDEFYAQRRREQQQAGDSAAGALAVPLALEVQILRISDSRLELLAADGSGSTVIELHRLEAQDLNLDGRPIPLTLETRVTGEQTLDLSLNGRISVDEQRQLLTLQQLALEVSGATAQPLLLKLSGEVDINRMIAELQLALEQADTRGEGSLRYAMHESPQLDASLHFNRLDPAMLALAGPEAVADAATTAEQPAPADGNRPLPLAALRQIDTRAELTIDQAVVGAHTIIGLELKARALDGVIQLQDASGELYGGKLALEATFNGKHNTAQLNSTGQLTGTDIAALLAATGSEPVMTGTASLDWQLDSTGRTSNELLGNLSGPIKLVGDQVVLTSIGIEGMLCKAVALTNQEPLTATFPGSTRVATLSADIQLADGKARLSPLRANLPQVALRGTGSFDLLSQDFSATFKATLSPELETLDHACRVSKRLTAIDWPVNCAGNVNTDPAKWCAVDTEEIIKDLGKNEAQRKIQKEAGKLFNKLFKND
jgi:AsmA protein